MNIKWKDIWFLPVALIVLIMNIILTGNLLSYIVIIMTAAYTIYNHKNAMLLLFIYFPIRPFLIEFNPTLKIIGDVIIILAFIKVVFLYRKEWKSLINFRWFEIAFFSFCIIGAFSAFLTGVSIISIIFQLRSFLLLYLIYYVVKRLSITNNDIKKLSWTILTMVIIVCIHGVIEKLSLRGFLLPSSWEELPLSSQNRIRIYGLVGNPNMLAVYLSLALVFIIYLKKHLSKKLNLVADLSLVLLFGVWFLTFSRGTWIAFAITILVYILMTRNWQAIKKIVITMVLGIFLIGLPINALAESLENAGFNSEKRETQRQYDQSDGGISERMEGTFDESFVEDSQNSGRLFILSKGFEIFLDNPIIGTGFGTFGDSATLSYGSPIYDEYGINHEIYSDNQYIQIIAQTGVMGVGLFGVFLLNMAYVIWKKRKKSKIAPILLSILMGAFVIGLLYNIWENYNFALFYFSILGYLLNETDEINPRK